MTLSADLPSRWCPQAMEVLARGDWGGGQYLRRSGASFVKMEHFEIADMLTGEGRRPQLVLTCRLFPPQPKGKNAMYRVHLNIENTR